MELNTIFKNSLLLISRVMNAVKNSINYSVRCQIKNFIFITIIILSFLTTAKEGFGKILHDDSYSFEVTELISKTITNRNLFYEIIVDIEKGQNNIEEIYFTKEELNNCSISIIGDLICIVFNLNKLYEKYALRYFYYKHNSWIYDGSFKNRHYDFQKDILSFTKQIRLIQDEVNDSVLNIKDMGKVKNITLTDKQLDRYSNIYLLQFVKKNNYILIRVKLSNTTREKTGCFNNPSISTNSKDFNSNKFFSQAETVYILLERIGLSLYTLVYADFCGLNNKSNDGILY